MKPTIGLVSSSGIVPISTKFDSAGPMTKSSYDLAALLDVITARDSSESYTKNLTRSWSDIAVAVLDPEIWNFPETYVKPLDEAEAQIVSLISVVLNGCGLKFYTDQARETRQAYEVIKSKAKKFVNDVDLVTDDKLDLNGESSEWKIIRACPSSFGNISFKLTFSVADTKRELNAYLEDLEESEVRSLAEIIDYNIKHANKELPSREKTSNCQNLVCVC